MAVAFAPAGSELHNGSLDTVNIALESGTRSMDEFTWAKEEMEAVDMLELPVVDLQKLRGASDEELRVMLKDLAKICSDWGFFRLLNHGVSDDMLQKLEEQTVRLFSLPSEVKRKATRSPTHEIGFFSGSDGYGFNSKLWWNETFQFYFDPESIDTQTLKLWPDGDGAEFSSTIKNYTRITNDLGLEILHYVITALNIDSSKYLQHFRGSNSCMRLNHYPACKRPENVLGLFAHTDDNVLTILFEDEVGGLQIQNNNTWFAIKPRPNSLVVNIGDILKVWSNNIYSSVVHRVAMKFDKRRLSVAFLLYPEEDSVIESAPELINAENPAKYKSFTFGEYRVSFYGATTLQQNMLPQFEQKM